MYKLRKKAVHPEKCWQIIRVNN